jgi:hypothetical protein
MDVSREEAERALDTARDAAERTKKMLAYAGADALLVLWGVIWVFGYLGSQFLPLVAGWLWLALNGTGIALSVVIWKRSAPVRSPESGRIGGRIGATWGLLYLYVYLWIGLLWPFLRVRGHEQSQMFYRHLGAIAGSIPMFAYVVMGLWLASFMLWTGLAVTALTILGLILVPAYFSLWMAVLGGGTLIGTGLVIRNRWK